MVRQVLVAHHADASSSVVPPALFGAFSYQLAHGELWTPPGHFRLRSGGNVTKLKDWDDALHCGPAVVDRDQHGNGQSLASIIRFARDTDGFYRRHPWIQRLGLEYGYPHHSPSNPALFRAIPGGPLSGVIDYSYVVQSACPVIRDGHLDPNVKIQSVYTFPARP